MPDRWSKIFFEQIAPMIGLDRMPGQSQPKLIVVGAQPGAGKSAEIARIERRLADAVVINGDEYRSFHPSYERFIREDLATAAERTSDAVSYWVSTALSEAQQRKCNVIMETTLRQPDLLHKTFSAFVANGYRVELRVLVVHPDLSRLGVYRRYLAAASIPGIAPRYSRRRYHDEALENQAITIKKLETLLEDVTLVDRQGSDIGLYFPPFPDWNLIISDARLNGAAALRGVSLCDEWKEVLEHLMAMTAPGEICESAKGEVSSHCT